MTGQFFAERGNLLNCHRTGAIAPLTALVCENVSDFLVGQGFVPGLHDSSAVLLALNRDWALQTLQHDHRRPPRSTGRKFRGSERWILAGHAKTVGLMTGLTIRCKN